jgi:prepilin-type processing-associated H-X9-DG protein
MQSNMQSGTIATDIHLDRQEQVLQVTFADGHVVRLAAEYLRVESPSAEVQGHSPAQRQLVHGKCHVRIVDIEPVGTYAIRLVFDDGHDSGLFTWAYLRRLGDDHASNWASYLEALQAAGRSR